MTKARTWAVASTVAVLIAGLAAPQAWALKLDETGIWIEINDTDGDAGIQIFLDGEDWDGMAVFDPDGTKILHVKARGSVGIQGVTELFLESAEPSFEDQPLDEFLGLFPPGRYRFSGMTTDGKPLRGNARLTHALPGAPVLVLRQVAVMTSVPPASTSAPPAGSSIISSHTGGSSTSIVVTFFTDQSPLWQLTLNVPPASPAV